MYTSCNAGREEVEKGRRLSSCDYDHSFATRVISVQDIPHRIEMDLKGAHSSLSK